MDYCSIDIEALKKYVMTKINSNDSAMPQKNSIFKIPNILYDLNPKAFTPIQFSIGPFHHHNPRIFKSNQEIKSKYLFDLFSRLSDFSQTDRDTLLMNITKEITIMSKEARDFYAVEIPVDILLKFAEILLLDGCFILELFRKKSYPELVEDDDPIFSTSFMMQFLWHDMVLLENQLPWFVLETLFHLTTTLIDKKSLVQLAIEFFDTIFSVAWPPIDFLDKPSSHILDMLRNAALGASEDVREEQESGLVREPMPSASLLEESGIKVRISERSRSILDVRFRRKEGVLEIPSLLIHDATETVFRNLICMELCCPNYKPIFISYALLMGNLINTPKDIEILCKNRVLLVWSDVQGTEFFNKLFIGSLLKKTYYLRLTNDVNRHCKRGWARYRTVFIRYYFNNPWAWISLTVAAFLALCTFFQAFYSVNNHLWATIVLVIAAVLVVFAFLKTLFTIGKELM